jgi:hypothetical protein
MNTAQGKHNGHRDIQHDSEMGFGLGGLDGFALADFSDSDFGCFDPDDIGGASSQLTDLGGEEPSEGTHGPTFELSDAESSIVRLVAGYLGRAGGSIAATGEKKIYITHEDFDEGPERDAFLLIFGYAEHLFDERKKSVFSLDDVIKQKAMRFFFCHGQTELHLDDAVDCIDNLIRTDVLRLRFMLEFWLRAWKLPALPDDAGLLPDRIELMAAQHGGTVGVALAREAWFEPGIDAEILISRVFEERADITLDQVKKSFNDLVCDYILSIADRKVYTTGKNPILEFADKINDPTQQSRGQLASINWSRRF